MGRMDSVRNNLVSILPSLPTNPRHGIKMDGMTKGDRGVELLEAYVGLVNEAVTN